MIWIEIVFTLIFIFAFVGGLKDGAVKGFFSLIALFIVIPTTGYFYPYFVNILQFIPDEIWRSFIGFFGTFIIFSIIIGLILLIPSKLLTAAWNKGVLYILLGGLFSVISCAISLSLLQIVVHTYPIFDWLDYFLSNSEVLSWFSKYFDFISLMLPELFHSGSIKAV